MRHTAARQKSYSSPISINKESVVTQPEGLVCHREWFRVAIEVLPPVSNRQAPKVLAIIGKRVHNDLDYLVYNHTCREPATSVLAISIATASVQLLHG